MAVEGITHGYAEVNGIRLHYAETGRGDDLVLLLHGFPEFWYSWRHQLQALRERFHVVAPDMRGYNLSDKPARVEDYRVAELVEDVLGLIDHFGADKAAIVAHDWGAGVAWALAQKYPERVSKLAVMQVPPAAAWRANMSLKQLLRSWYMFLFQIPRLPEWMLAAKDFQAIDRTFTERVIRKGSFDDADIQLYKMALRQPGALTAAVNYYRANVIDRLRARGPVDAEGKISNRIRVPTLFIFGEQDFAILPQTVRGLVKYIDAPYSELRIPDSGHWVQNEAAEEVNAALIKFLSEDLSIRNERNG
jgi:pimeloyl-ACP methyl ester carboxylesterase